jgi:hypothetical protein
MTDADTTEHQASFDLSELSENSRIQAIGLAVTEGKLVGVAFERDPEMIERYVRKVMERFPMVGVVDIIDGPDNLVGVQFGRKPQ